MSHLRMHLALGLRYVAGLKRIDAKISPTIHLMKLILQGVYTFGN